MKMYYFYGVMGSSKTAMALMKKFSFEEHGKKVLLAKPATDFRDGERVLKSRIDLKSIAVVLEEGETLREKVKNLDLYDVIITDESQFVTENQIEELRMLADNDYIVMCFGLKTDYMSRLFEGNKQVFSYIRKLLTSCIYTHKLIPQSTKKAFFCGTISLYKKTK